MLTGELVTAAQVREQKLMVRYAHVYLFNSKGEMLVQQRPAMAKARPNLMDPSAAGHVDQGQSYEECAYNEMWEEVGVKTPLTKLFMYSGYWGFAEVYKGTWDGEITLQEREVAHAAWVPLDVLDGIMKHTPWLVSDGFVGSYEIFRGWKEVE